VVIFSGADVRKVMHADLKEKNDRQNVVAAFSKNVNKENYDDRIRPMIAYKK